MSHAEDGFFDFLVSQRRVFVETRRDQDGIKQNDHCLKDDRDNCSPDPPIFTEAAHNREQSGYGDCTNDESDDKRNEELNEPGPKVWFSSAYLCSRK